MKTLRGRFRPTKCALVPHARAADYVYGTRHPLEKMAFEASLGPAQLGRSTGHRSTPSKTFLAAVVVSVSMKGDQPKNPPPPLTKTVEVSPETVLPKELAFEWEKYLARCLAGPEASGFEQVAVRRVKEVGPRG